MKNKEVKENIIPSQKVGSETGAKHEVVCDDVQQAQATFNKGKECLQAIDKWSEYCTVSAMKSALTDKNGSVVTRKPEVGDYIRIDIAGPGPRSGDGYDWVRIEEIMQSGNADQEEELFGMRVRPASSPVNSDRDTSHFYTTEATSTFIVERKGLVVSASETGKNEVPNTETEKITDKVRNAVVATSGIAGFSEVQWKMLMKGLLSD